MQEQLTLDFDPLPTFRVGVRVKGDSSSQIYDVQAVDGKQAEQLVREGVENVTVALVRQL